MMKKIEMTAQKEKSIRRKIDNIKAGLAADKKFWGGYHHDGKGLRYLPPQYYIQLQDYAGGLRYLRWFNRIFPRDAAYPDFFFEWAIILFKAGKKKEGKSMIFRTFFYNTYLLDWFFKLPVIPIEKEEYFIFEKPDYPVKHSIYSCADGQLEDFSLWLQQLYCGEEFREVKEAYINIQIRLKTETDSELVHYLKSRKSQIMERH